MSDSKNKLNNSKLLYIYKVGNVALSLACAVICALATLFFYDYNPGYFKMGATTVILYIAIAIAIVFAISATVILKKDFKLASPTSRESHPLISIIPACAFIYYTISLTPAAFSGSSKPSTYFLQIALAIISFAYFFISAVEISIDKSILTVLGLASIASPILIAVKSYFDYTTVMNGPEKLFMQFGMIFFALFIINEVRFVLDRSYPRFYICIASLSSVFCITSAANKICILAKNPTFVTNESLSLAVILLAFGVYSALRLIFAKQSTEVIDTVSVVINEETSSDTNEDTPAETSENDSASAGQDASAVALNESQANSKSADVSDSEPQQ